MIRQAYDFAYRATLLWVVFVAIAVGYVKYTSDDTTRRFNATQAGICHLFKAGNTANATQKLVLQRLADRSRFRARLDKAHGDPVAAQGDLDSAAFYGAQAARIHRATFPGC